MKAIRDFYIFESENKIFYPFENDSVYCFKTKTDYPLYIVDKWSLQQSDSLKKSFEISKNVLPVFLTQNALMNFIYKSFENEHMQLLKIDFSDELYEDDYEAVKRLLTMNYRDALLEYISEIQHDYDVNICEVSMTYYSKQLTLNNNGIINIDHENLSLLLEDNAISNLILRTI